MSQIEIYTKNWCIYCKRSKAKLQELGLSYQEIDVTDDPQLEEQMRERSQQFTVPQIFVNGTHLGGNSDLNVAIASGQLDQFLKETVA